MAILRIKNKNGSWEEIPAIVGRKGDAGVGISSTSINENGELVINYTNGVVVNAGRVVGAKGDKYVLTTADKNELVSLLKNSLTTQTWKFTLEDGTIIQKEVYSFD
jgi:predicted DNA binding protein